MMYHRTPCTGQAQQLMGKGGNEVILYLHSVLRHHLFIQCLLSIMENHRLLQRYVIGRQKFALFENFKITAKIHFLYLSILGYLECFGIIHLTQQRTEAKYKQ